MFAISDLETGFGRESRSITPGLAVLALIVCVSFALWIAGALSRRATRRAPADDEN